MRRSSVSRSAVWLAAAVLVLLGVWAPGAAAQGTGTVRGTVAAAGSARPLAGVQVTVAGTRLGAVSDASGQFVIQGVPVGQQTLRAQMLGYSAQERTVAVTPGQTASPRFELAESAISLDAVVVTGTPGATTKRALGNAVTKVNAADLTEKAPIANVQELLAARAPGVTVLSNSGQVGSGSKIRIRGAGSLSGRVEPVIYVDGVRMYSATQGGYSTSNGVVQGTSALDAINPEDIESMEVIKGPAAATLYGADAASGVVQIITKKGRGVQGVKWTAQVDAGQSDWALPTPLNYTLCTADRIGNADWPGCAGQSPNTLLTDNPLRNSYECQFTEGCQPNPLRTGQALGLNLSARGGGQNFNYYLSGERSSEDGVFFNNFDKRISGRGNFGFNPSPKLNFNVNLSYARTHVMMPLNNNSSNSVLRNAFRGRPGYVAPWQVGFKGFSPELSNQYDNQTRTERYILGATVNYLPTTWLSNRLTVGLDRNDRNNTVFYRLDETGKQPWGAVEATGAIYEYLPVTHVWTLDYAGTATARVNSDLQSDFSAGMQLNAYQLQSHEAIGEGLVANNLNLVSSAANTRAGEAREAQNSLGFYVQEQLGWRDRLFLTGALRVDDNSAFGQNFSLVTYPKLSASWVVSEEPFFHVSAFDNVRLRAAWGQAGNAPEPFSADRTLAPSIALAADVPVNQLRFDAYGNPDLRAETGSEVELGFDASMLQGRLGAEFTYYNKHTRDALISIPDPRSSGYSGTHLTNVGEIANSGLELQINATPFQSRPFTWETTLSGSTLRNQLVSFGGARDEIAFGAFATVQKHKEGYPLGGFWAKDVLRDAQGNPVLTKGRATVDPKSERYIGPMLPTRTLAWMNTLTVMRNLRLYGNLDYQAGHYQWCAICSIRNRFDRNTIQVNDPNATPDQIAVWTSDQTLTYIQPADFVKLRELSATLSLPAQWAGRFGSDQASVTLSGRNLWMWSKYAQRTDMVDPEVTFYSQSNFTQLDYGSAPMLRRVMLTVRLSF